jgi:acyl dehydratase
MAFDPGTLLSLPPRITRQIYTKRDTILYALGVGAGIDNPTDLSALRYVYERDLVALPTMAIVLAAPPFWFDDPGLGIDWQRVLNAGQDLVLERPLPTEGSVSTELKIEAIWDKGKDRGAVMESSRILLDAAGSRLAAIRQTHFLRGNGGFGGLPPPKIDEHPAPRDRAPDQVIDLPTRPEQALLYRLSGDYNPLHADPEVARSAGFQGPILHGSCTFGIVARAVLQACGGAQTGHLRRFGARFSSPVYPGETIQTQIWRESSGILFRARSLDRNLVVLDRGMAVIGEPPR